MVQTEWLAVIRFTTEIVNCIRFTTNTFRDWEL